MPALTNSEKMKSFIISLFWLINDNKMIYLFSMTGTSTACRVFGRSLEPGFRAPQPAAHPNLPKKSSFFSGKHIGAAKQ